MRISGTRSPSGSDDIAHFEQRRQFDALCTPFRVDLLRFLFWLCHDHALAEDVMQETLLRAWRSFDSLQDRGAAKAWLLTIARRELARFFERKRLNEVLTRSGVHLKRGAGTVSDAVSCWFRGHYVPHLVVQRDQGPVTVLLLTQERGVKRRKVFNEGGFQGVVLPAPRGALAVLAQDAQVEQAVERFLQAVEYQP
jgi:hypothetical protein